MVNLGVYHHIHTPNHLIEKLAVVESYLLIKFLVVRWRNLQGFRFFPEQWGDSSCDFAEHSASFLFWLSFSKLLNKLVSSGDEVLHVVDAVLLVRKMTDHKSFDVWFLFNTKLRMLSNQRCDLFVGFGKFGKTFLLTELAWLFGHEFKDVGQLRIAAWYAVIMSLDFAQYWLDAMDGF